MIGGLDGPPEGATTMKHRLHHKPTPEVDTQTMPTPTLVATDRCVRCDAQAWYLMKRGTTTLLFCGHHHTEHVDALTQQGWCCVVDDRRLRS